MAKSRRSASKFDSHPKRMHGSTRRPLSGAFWRDHGREALARAFRHFNLKTVLCGCEACYSLGRCDDDDRQPGQTECDLIPRVLELATLSGVTVGYVGEFPERLPCDPIENAEASVRARLGGREFATPACVNAPFHLVREREDGGWGEMSFGRTLGESSAQERRSYRRFFEDLVEDTQTNDHI